MISIVGSLNMDLVINTDRIPRPGETVMGQSFKQIPGGKGANQADAIAKLGGSVKMIGCVGKDSMGKSLKESLLNDGANVENVFESGFSSTGVAAILVEKSGNNAITVAPGANYFLTPEHIRGCREIIQNSKVLLTQLETKIDTVKTALEIAKENSVITILNPAPAVELDKEILNLVDILTPNETELEILSGHRTDTIENINKAADIIIEQCNCDLVVTLGGNGCIYIGKEGRVHLPAYKIKAIDTTAAGDSFNGAIAYCLDNGQSIIDSLKFAMKVGAMTVTKTGAQTSLPLMKDLIKFDDWLKEEQNEKR